MATGFPKRYPDKTISTVTTLAAGSTGYGEVYDGDGQPKRLLLSDLKNALLALSTKTLLDAGTLAGAGSSQGTAAAIVHTVTSVTGADGTVAVVMPTAVAGDFRLVYNAVATNGLPIYPASGAAFNGGSSDAAITIEGKTLALLVATSTTNWAAVYTANT